MVVIAALVFALGIALAQFYRVLVLLPATVVVVLGVSIFEVTGAHGIAHMLLSCWLVAFALQSGFLAGSSLSHVIVRVAKPFVASSMRSK
jgi:hypothetical protein